MAGSLQAKQYELLLSFLPDALSQGACQGRHRSGSYPASRSAQENETRQLVVVVVCLFFARAPSLQLTWQLTGAPFKRKSLPGTTQVPC